MTGVRFSDNIRRVRCYAVSPLVARLARHECHGKPWQKHVNSLITFVVVFSKLHHDLQCHHTRKTQAFIRSGTTVILWQTDNQPRLPPPSLWRPFSTSISVSWCPLVSSFTCSRKETLWITGTDILQATQLTYQYEQITERNNHNVPHKFIN